MAEKRKPGLGRGLAALLQEVETAPAAQAPALLPIEQIAPNPDQPRRHFDEEKLAELAASIADKGVLQPIVVRPAGPDRYEIVAGERRWRAAQLARLHEIPAVVRDFAPGEALTVAIVENIQRHDLNALEEARAYQRLMQDFGHTQEEVARVVGKSRSHIANLVRLLDLPHQTHLLLASGRISMGHARALLGTPDPDALATAAADAGWSVRETEARAAAAAGRNGSRAPVPKPAPKDADIAALERLLSESLGLKVAIEHGGTTGRVTVRYAALDQLDFVVRRLTGGPA